MKASALSGESQQREATELRLLTQLHMASPLSQRSQVHLGWNNNRTLHSYMVGRQESQNTPSSLSSFPWPTGLPFSPGADAWGTPGPMGCWFLFAGICGRGRTDCLWPQEGSQQTSCLALWKCTRESHSYFGVLGRQRHLPETQGSSWLTSELLFSIALTWDGIYFLWPALLTQVVLSPKQSFSMKRWQTKGSVISHDPFPLNSREPWKLCSSSGESGKMAPTFQRRLFWLIVSLESWFVQGSNQRKHWLGLRIDTLHVPLELFSAGGMITLSFGSLMGSLNLLKGFSWSRCWPPSAEHGWISEKKTGEH